MRFALAQETKYWLLAILWLIAHVTGLSYLWGRTNPYEIPIFDIDLNISVKDNLPPGDKAYVDVVYPSEKMTNDYLITSMAAVDESGELKPGVEADILSGGIGFNYTKVRFFSTHLSVRFNFIVHGVPTEYAQFINFKP